MISNYVKTVIIQMLKRAIKLEFYLTDPKTSLTKLQLSITFRFQVKTV